MHGFEVTEHDIINKRIIHSSFYIGNPLFGDSITHPVKIRFKKKKLLKFKYITKLRKKIKKYSKKLIRKLILPIRTYQPS